MVKTRLKKTKLRTLTKVISQYKINSTEWHMACVPSNLRHISKDLTLSLEYLHYLLHFVGDKSDLEEFQKKLEERVPLGFKFGELSNPPLTLGEKASPAEIAMFSHWQIEEVQYITAFIRQTLENMIKKD